MKYFKKIFLTCAMIAILIATITNSICLGNTDDKVIIITENNDIDYVRYGSSTISSKKITDNKNYIGYCLDIERDYPSGEYFTKIATIKDRGLKGIITNGYPNIKGKDFGLTDDEVYFATQIAIWSYQEGYDISKITSNNKKVETLIKDIYTNGVNINARGLIDLDVYYTSNSVQRIILVKESDTQGISDIKEDLIQQNG